MENAYITILIRVLRKDQLGFQDFSGESKAFIKDHIYYNTFKLPKVGLMPSYEGFQAYLRKVLNGKLFTRGSTENHREVWVIELQSDLNAA